MSLGSHKGHRLVGVGVTGGFKPPNLGARSLAENLSSLNMDNL